MQANMLPVPSPIKITHDMAKTAEEWKFFKLQWKYYSAATELDKKSDETQIAILLSIIGKDCLAVYENLPKDGSGMQNAKNILDSLTNYFEPKRNIIYERYVFNTTSQEPDESVDKYVNRLRKLISTCEYGTLEEDLLRDRLVLGIRSGQTRKSLLKISSLTLNTALDICRTEEITEKQMQKLAKSTEQNEDVKVAKPFQKQQLKPQVREPHEKEGKCKFCGNCHKYGRQNCPAFGQMCKLCKRKNHFAKVCRTMAPNDQKERKSTTSKLRVVEDRETSETSSEESLFHLSGASSSQNRKMMTRIKLEIEGNEETIECQLDTGATCNVISYSDVCKIAHDGVPRLELSSTKLRGFAGNIVRPRGQIYINCKTRNEHKRCVFQVVDLRQPPLISAQTCQDLQLLTISEQVYAIEKSNLVPGSLTIDDITSSYQDVFTGLGCFPGLYKLHIDPTVPPVQQSPRRIPIALRKDLKNHLEELENKKIITKVTEPTEWISNLVVVKKKDTKKLRICLDPKDLNKALKRSHYQIPTIDEILPQLAQAKVFSIVDAKDGFWQVKMDEESSRLTTFWTPFGRYRWLRMPFGIKTAPEEYQRRQQEVLLGLKGVEVIADDIIIYGCGNTLEEAMTDHDECFIRLMERVRQQNMKLNKSKCKFKLQSVSYLGHLLTSDGLKPDPSKIAAVTNAPTPRDKQHLQSFLGFIVYLSKFLPHLSEVTEPLRQLTREKAEWTWEKTQEDAFRQLKKMVTEAPVLKYFDMDKPTTIQCDASSYGVGAVLMQQGQPVAYASKTLTNTEKNYAQIEKECLAIVFACEKFAQYIIGKKDIITVESDHKPLEVIFRKSLLSAPKRLQRMLLRLQRYNIEVVYRKGKEVVLADYLSRSPLSETCPTQSEITDIWLVRDNIYEEIEQIDMREYVNVSDQSMDNIKKEMCRDPTMKMLMDTIQEGWPNSRNDLINDIKMFWEFREELSVQNDVVYKGCKVFIPPALRNEMATKVHAQHLGIEACIRKAKDVIFWPGMLKDIEKLVRSCKTCQKFAPAQPKEPLLQYPVPDEPWSQIGIEIFYLQGERYLILVDYYSDFWELDKLSNADTEKIVKHIKPMFGRFGIPKCVVTDNGPQFASTEFQKFAEEWNFKHVTCSPKHSQSNGKAESAVKIAKTLIRKCKDAKQDLWVGILEWRNTPTEGMDSSPVQRLMSRRTRTLLPISSQLLRPEVAQNVQEKIVNKKRKQKRFYDRSAKSLSAIRSGENVRIRLNRMWKEGRCVGQVGPRSFEVEVQGRLYRRNRKQLKPINN